MRQLAFLAHRHEALPKFVARPRRPRMKPRASMGDEIDRMSRTQHQPVHRRAQPARVKSSVVIRRT